jgi:two-component system, OmpR family, sensor histidine kinase ArlS
LKFNFASIRFRSWIYFTSFAIIILLVLFLSVTLLFEAFYQNRKIEQTTTLANEIIDYINENTSFTTIDRLSFNNNICVVVIGNNGNTLYSSDNIGAGCVLNQANEFNLFEKFLLLKKEPENVYREFIQHTRYEQTSLVVGQKVESNLFSYYFFIATPLLPFSSTIDILSNQIWWVSGFVLVLAFLLSINFSNLIAEPISQMATGAKQLAVGNYQYTFNGLYFNETRNLADSLNLAASRLSKLDLTRKELFANISHDLKTPLTMILAYTELIKDISGNDKKKREEHLAIIEKETNYLSSLINEMELMSNQESQLRLEQFNFSNEITMMMNSFLGAYRQTKVKFESYVDEDIIVEADRIKLLRVVQNFVANAVKHSDKGKLVEVSLIRSNNKARLTVKDFGHGISKDLLPLIWERYYRVSSNFHRNTEGSGLGLSIAKAILEQHHLNYGVESEEGKGSEFYFEINIIDGNNS